VTGTRQGPLRPDGWLPWVLEADDRTRRLRSLLYAANAVLLSLAALAGVVLAITPSNVIATVAAGLGAAGVPVGVAAVVRRQRR